MLTVFANIRTATNVAKTIAMNGKGMPAGTALFDEVPTI